ncbi:hypothetical protein E0L36_21345 [Streptomyces sp. AJS327]|uniref:hypothetical protein n=1 Tax=Streptomyces sp. AJS327 TaxID=2545265 RepID=UPI0015DFFA22|nr:hypothetical protein [Streptomyces sp. AJS327]MBA0053325.1 hypothetical protein [Streptomyces sp. AJS327]
MPEPPRRRSATAATSRSSSRTSAPSRTTSPRSGWTSRPPAHTVGSPAHTVGRRRRATSGASREVRSFAVPSFGGARHHGHPGHHASSRPARRGVTRCGAGLSAVLVRTPERALLVWKVLRADTERLPPLALRDAEAAPSPPPPARAVRATCVALTECRFPEADAVPRPSSGTVRRRREPLSEDRTTTTARARLG